MFDFGSQNSHQYIRLNMENFSLWQRSLAIQNDSFDKPREILRASFLAFREHAKLLVNEIAGLLPELTVHDITHLDALWRVADQICGADYPLTPAEAYVLGGAFLLHDAAHVLAAYTNRLADIKDSLAWKDLIAQQFDGVEPVSNSPQEQLALFQVLRQLHAKQAHELPHLHWQAPGTSSQIYLIEHAELRQYYGDLIGEIAESHHWSAHRVAEEFGDRILAAPGFLSPATWEVNALKIALLLRTADAAHIDSQRAPWFLFALRQPKGISEQHWRFQTKMGQLSRTPEGLLRISAGSPFGTNERQAWWLAYDTAKMIDRELNDAQALLQEYNCPPFAAKGVLNISSTNAFAKSVRTKDWEPVNVEPVISDVAKVITNFGGAKLYGDKPELALRELIQNSADAIRALRAFGQLGPLEGEIEVALTMENEQLWLHVTDQGIGMSKYVLTKVLPDFGNSLWSSDALRTELPGLASKQFQSVGQFGIGFFSVFMLGNHVSVTTRRYRTAEGDKNDQWLLEFENNLSSRPILRKPKEKEELLRAGTRVSVAISADILHKISAVRNKKWHIEGLPKFYGDVKFERWETQTEENIDFGLIVANLCPTIDISIKVKIGDNDAKCVVTPNDWENLPEINLLKRLYVRNHSLNEILEKGRLINLHDKKEGMVGRVGYFDDYSAIAFSSYKGILTGEIRKKFIGVILGKNNLNLARSEMLVSIAYKTWENWAHECLEIQGRQDVNMMLALHPICRKLRLCVYEFNGNHYSEHELLELLKTIREINVCIGTIEYDYDEDISKYQFENYFQLNEDILLCPKSKGDLFSWLGLEEISYQDRLESALKEAWGHFNLYEDKVEVGKVNNVDIFRRVYFYERHFSD